MIIGHQKQWQFLRKSAETQRLSHAYLFLGPAHLGKRTLAKEFIKSLNCQKKQETPCQTCWPCQALEKETHPDLILIKPEGKEIKISQIRNLQYVLSHRPHSSSFKTAILEEAEKMNQESQNSLLKTLEEPSNNTLLFLISAYPEMLFPTILSRVQKIKFSQVGKSEIKRFLKNRRISSAEIEQIASLSFGKPGLAMEFSKNTENFRKEDQKIKEIERIVQGPLSLRFQYVRNLTHQEQDLQDTLENWLRYFQDILRMKMGLAAELEISPTPNFNLSTAQLKKIIHFIERINFLISSTNINSKLAFETLMLQF